MGLEGTLDIETEKVANELAVLRNKRELNQEEKEMFGRLKRQLHDRLVIKDVDQQIKSIK
jgi:hypothetical protein